MIRVLVADDHPVMRAGLEAVLRGEPGFVCCGSVPTRDVCGRMRRTRPDVLLGTRGPLLSTEDVVAVVDPADDVPAMLDRLRLAVREARKAA